MKPWFIQEDNVIPFPKKDTSVVRLPNVNAYPDFLSGVQDLQNHLKQGDISSDIHKKLYQDLIHRFMKTESFETPWFLREAEIITEVASINALVGQEIVKERPGFNRKEIFLNKIINSQPFDTMDNKKFVIPPIINNYDNKSIFISWVKNHTQGAGRLLLKGYFADNKKQIIDLTILKSTSTPFKLKKSEEFTDKGKSVAGSKENSAEYVAASAIQLDKKEYKGRVALLSAIVNNSFLKKSQIGKKVIEIANGISKGQTTFDFTALSPGEFTAIRDYAMEYLGVLMVAFDLSNFENKSSFQKHVGNVTFEQMTISFPAGRSNPISDAIATVAGFINPNSGNSIWLSVKGGTTGKGAAWSVRSLKIPNGLRKSKDYTQSISLIELMQGASGLNEPFQLLDWCIKNNIDTGFSRDYSYNQEEIENARKGNFQGSIKKLLNIVQSNKEMKQYFVKKDSFRVLHYLLSQYIINQLNSGVLPNITPLVREILQQNFLKISNIINPKTPAKNNQIETSVLWPNKDLGTGTVTFANKNDMKSAGAFNKIAIRID